ncbi:guanine deaminase-like [Pecten maximus]|uniref:guanine deaminase-like n=1 Tax=Pecten maximus TaxID=6579 RepID=UPI001458AA7A|nr:guanine deaminase-like [Pecten maximus]
MLLNAGFPCGQCVNKFGVRKMGICAGFLASTGLILSFFATSIPYLITTVGVVTGFGLSLGYVSITTSVGEHFNGKARFVALSFVASGSGCGAMAFPFLLDTLIQTYGWRGCLLIVGGLMGNMICFFAVCQPQLVDKSYYSPGLLETEGMSQQTQHNQQICENRNSAMNGSGTFIPKQQRPSIEKLRLLSRNSPFIVFIIAVCCTLPAYDSTLIYLIEFFKTKSFANKEALLLYFFMNVGNTTGRHFVVPGFVDTHIHASQYPNCGKCLDVGMLSWLHKYTIPTEAKFAELEFARKKYWKVVTRVIKNGTTTASYLATIYTDSTLELCDIIQSVGQRAIVGKVNMDQNSLDFYTEKTVTSVEETIRYIQEVARRKYTHIKPCITPRFAGNCSMELMTQLGQIAQSGKLHVQTHLAETREECDMVRKLFPENRSYTDIYNDAGLLTQKTVLAHGIHLTSEERKLIRLRHSGISHCPNSNIAIRSGLLDVRTCLDENISVGLGTDISGGYSSSILNAMRAAICTSNTIAIQTNLEYRPLDYKDVFQMATLGGAKVLDMDDVIGNFEVGKEFDALLIDPAVDGGPIDVFEDDTIEDIVQKFIFLGDDRNILRVFVSGNNILENLIKKSSEA